MNKRALINELAAGAGFWAAVIAVTAMLGSDASAIEMPPKKYDHAPKMEWIVKGNQGPALYGAPEPFGCGSVKHRSVACTFVWKGKCWTYVKAGMKQSVLPKIIRHERGHCNGWVHR